LTIREETKERIASAERDRDTGVANDCLDLRGVQADCERLTPFGTITRYPGSIMQAGLEHMPMVTSWMENIRESVRSCLDLSGEECVLR
jgi:hypothetical protein